MVECGIQCDRIGLLLKGLDGLVNKIIETFVWRETVFEYEQKRQSFLIYFIFLYIAKSVTCYLWSSSKGQKLASFILNYYVKH